MVIRLPSDVLGEAEPRTREICFNTNFCLVMQSFEYPNTSFLQNPTILYLLCSSGGGQRMPLTLPIWWSVTRKRNKNYVASHSMGFGLNDRDTGWPH